MTSARDHSTILRGLVRRMGRPAPIALGLVLSCALIGPTLAVAPSSRESQSAPQVMAQRAVRGSDTARVTFKITQSKKYASDSRDQVTIIFSDRAWGGSTPPYPLFGEDILEEFSFSAADLSDQRPLTFTRTIADRRFLDARYIRVVNHGAEGWDGGTLSMAVDGRMILENVPLQPRKGDPSKGLQNWNRRQWSERTYWEAELQLIRRR